VPDVVLLDAEMPTTRGLDVCRAISADPRLRGVRVVMVTAKAQQVDREAAHGAGGDDYVVKPFSPRELLRRLAHHGGRPAPR
jgi:DNA-binding response OmpR family regulator